jgi:hypothetical protein
MKFLDRVLLKIIIIQFFILLCTQVLFHQWNVLPELQQITQYEGVTENNITKILETFSE